jgi:DNA-binding NarL/FixJ family response regulator
VATHTPFNVRLTAMLAMLLTTAQSATRAASARAVSQARQILGDDRFTRAWKEGVGAGLRNDAIAQRLFIVPGTVKVHLSHIFAKLGITTRAELAARAASHDLTAS